MADETHGRRTPSWGEVAAAKREALLASIPPEWRIPAHLLPPESQEDVVDWPKTSGWFTASELAVTAQTASELVAQLASGRLTSEVVTAAFCKRACAAQQLTNCLSETCFQRAMETARARDAHLARKGVPVGPLHGLPVSIKDCFNLRGLDSTLGLVSHIGDAAESDSSLATLLEDAGAVLYVKTNVAAAMMIAESVNNIFGRTSNPRNRQTTSGGSSGGESALITFKGSPLGVGTDIGGSLRIPTACTGAFTLRPSFGRFPVRSTRSGMPGQEAVASVNGPMADSYDDLELYCRAVLQQRPWLCDPRCLPIPWRPVELAPRLKIGVMYDNAMVLPTPPVARALRSVAERLKAQGHEIVDWDPVDQPKGYELMYRLFTADGGTAIRREIERGGEPWMPELEIFQNASSISVFEMWKLQLQRSDFQGRYLDRWNAADIDAILCPVMPFNATRHGSFKHVGYTGVFNVLDYPCISFRTDIVADKVLDAPDPNYKSLSEECEAIHKEYDPGLVHGLPVNLQLVARRLEEEKVLAIGRVVLDAISADRTPAGQA